MSDIASQLKRLEKMIKEGFDKNDKKHEELEILLFRGNGKPSLKTRIEMNETKIETINEQIKSLSGSVEEFTKSMLLFVQETKDNIHSLNNDNDQIKVDTQKNTRFINRLDAQITLWKWIAGMLGITNIIQIIINLK